MTEKEALFEEFRTLLLKSFHGELEPSEADRISEILATEAGAYAYYRDFLKVTLALHELQGQASADSVRDHKFWSELAMYEQTAPGVPVQPALPQAAAMNIPLPLPARKISRLSIAAAILSSAALLLIFLFVRYTPPQTSIAHCRRTIDARWADGGAIEQDMPLAPGTLTLVSGIAEIELNGGARVILEGPVTAALESTSRVFLTRGRLVADIKNSTEDRFVVRTPNSTVVDFGTEFGVEVDSQGQTLAHVFEGSVEMRSGSDPLKFDSAVGLKAGQGAAISHEGTITPVACQPRMFTRQEQVDTRLLAAQGSRLHQWKTYNLTLDRDPALAAHYTFEQNPAKPDILSDCGPQADMLSGTLGRDGRRPDWTVGRWPRKTALQFDRGKDQQVVVPACGELAIGGPITVAAWVRVDDTTTGGHILSCRNGAVVNYQLAWFGSEHQFEGHQNRIQFFRYNQTPATGNMFSGNVTIEPGRWHLVAVTHDNKKINFYLDGKQISSSDYDYEHQTVEADLIIGDVDPRLKGYEKNRFHGTIDEIAILRRAMSQVEIDAMYRVGRPE